MLLQFRFKNYKSFYDECVLDLTPSKEIAHENHFLIKNNNKVLSTVAIHGNNASGKTNLLNALFYVRYWVINSISIDEEDTFCNIPYFKFDSKMEETPSEFEIFIEHNDYEYQYGFTIIRNHIIDEWLYKKRFSNRATKNKLIFERKENKIKTTDQKLESLFEVIKKDNVLFASVLGKRQIEPGCYIYDFFNHMEGFSDKSINTRTREIKTNKLLSENNEIKEKTESLLKEIDYNINGLAIKKENYFKQPKIYGLHQFNGETYELDLQEESLGTIKFINIIPHIFNVLIEGGIVLVDELDTKFHPLAYRKIVALFYDKDINKNGAQLIFTTHSTFLFNADDMRRDQIIMTEKDKNGKSTIYSLSDFEKLRIDSNYEKKYLAGEFGAIPFIDRD